jgi:TonB family protein
MLRIGFAALLLGGVLPCASVHAQPARDGSFHLRVRADASGEDHALAIVFPDSQAGEGALMWACDGAGMVAGVRMHDLDRGGVRNVVWRFDGDAPDTSAFQGSRESALWLVDAVDVERFTRRARTAARLEIVAPGDSASRPAMEFRYSLGGADSALGILQCDANPRGRPAGRATLARASETPWLDAGGTLTDAPWAVGPSLRNVSETQRYLARSYPAELRSGGVTGQVEVKFRVMEDGTVDPASVQAVSATHPAFAPVAMAAVTRARFRPGEAYGRPVKTWVEFPINFALDAGSPTAPANLPSPSSAPAPPAHPRR